MNPQRRLTRSSSNRLVAGVCGGLAEYFGIDPTLVRVLFVLLVLAAGMSPLIYLVLWVVLPSETLSTGSWTQQVQHAFGEMRDQATTVTDQVTSQIQKVSGGSSPPAPPADGGTDSSSTGPTTRL